MNNLAEDMTVGRRRSERAIPRTLAALRRAPELLARHAQARREDRELRRIIHGPDRLDDRLLKDVGLVREHLSNGRTRITRR